MELEGGVTEVSSGGHRGFDGILSYFFHCLFSPPPLHTPRLPQSPARI